MKTIKLFAITISIAFILGFTACLESGGSRYSYTYGSPAVVEHNPQAGTFLRTAYGSFVPDSASASNIGDLSDDACIYIKFEYNSEYQTGQYPVASNIAYEVVKSGSIFDDDVADRLFPYHYPLSSVELFKESLSPNYKGRFFVLTKAKLDKNQALDYILYYKSGEETDENGAINIYLQAHLPVTSTGAQDISEICALDVRDIVRSFGRDTTITEGGINYPLIYLKVNLKYISGMEDDVPVYKSASTQSIYIYMFKDDL
ncbi:MAG: hypothetical protein LBB73_00125 [Dysgonamonadaceae bacterium]|jgi:hypothetical protein|nr:hypothetical protein [Dysgonamonadaceae bacterium]